MSRPLIVVVPHVREVDTPLGRMRGAIAYEAYLDRIVSAGGEPLIVWQGTGDVSEVVRLAHGILLVGGGDLDPARFAGAIEAAEAVDHARDAFETTLVRAARAVRVPVLGVCRGCQVLNVALGGTLELVEGHRQTQTLALSSHPVVLAAGSRLGEVVGGTHLKVNSFHRWRVADLGLGLVAAARSPDGGIEAIEAKGEWWAIGVQWHAELLGEERASSAVFEGLVGAASGGRRR